MKSQVVNVYRDRERAGGLHNVLGTEFVNAKKYGKLFERLERQQNRMVDPEELVILGLESYYHRVSSVHPLPQEGLAQLVNTFRRASRNLYKNPQMFLLGWLYATTGMPVVRRVIQETGEMDISESDVIRYYRLYSSLTS